jgi:restriction system protein
MTPRERLKRLALISAAVGSATASGMAAAIGMAVEHDEALALRPGDTDGNAEEAPSLFLPDLPIVIQAIVEPVGSDPSGSIITTIGPAWKALLEALAKDPEVLRKLSPRQVEELVAASYEQAGFEEVILTPRSGDLGRDVIATKRGFCTIRIIDQVKHYAPDHRVSANDVRALVGVLLSDERATKGFVTTTASFAPGISTDPFIAKHVPYRLELVDGQALLGRLGAKA